MNPKLSIFVVTYNQESYIEQCLDSIVNQKVDFEYEIIIGEDCSTDNTGYLCDEFASKHPNVKVFHHKNNIGHVKNWEFVLNHCTGKYIAMIEGDDFWTDTNKLQTQINFLEQNNDYVLTFHKVQLVYENITIEENLFKDLSNKDYSAEEIYKEWRILTSSVVYRSPKISISFPKQIYFCDIYLFLLILEYGKCRCMDINAVAYRRHEKNLSSSQDISLSIKLYKQYHFMKKAFPQYNEITNLNIKHYLYDLVYNYHDIKCVKYMIIFMLQHPQKILSAKYWNRLLKNMFLK